MGLGSTLGSMYGSKASQFSTMTIWIGIFLVCSVVVYFIAMAFINKKRFVYKVRVYQTRENGSVKELNYKGGYLRNKQTGINKFRIKTGRFPWNKIDLTTTPNTSAIDHENRVYYKQIDLRTYIQIKRVFDKSLLIYKPVEQDVIYGAMLEMKGIDQALSKENMLSKVAPFIALGIIFVACIIGWYFLMDAKCPAVG